MTDPVVPVQPGGPAFPPPAGAPGYPPSHPGAPGQPQGHPGVPGHPQGNTGAPPFPPAQPGGEFPAAQPETPKKGWARRILGIAVTILVVVLVKTFLGSLISGDPTGDAKAGDCIAIKNQMSETATQVEAEMAECSSADAKYTVLGRVDGVTNLQSTACDATFNAQLKEGEEGYVISSDKGDGYLLCLKTK